MLKKISSFIFILALGLAGAAYFFYQNQGRRVVKLHLEKWLSTTLRSEVTILSFEEIWKWPFTAELLQVKLTKNKNFTAEIPKIVLTLGFSEIQLEKLKLKPSLDIQMDSPQITLDLADTDQKWPFLSSPVEKIKTALQLQHPQNPVSDVTLGLSMKNARFDLQNGKSDLLRLRALDIELHTSSMNEDPEIKIQGEAIPHLPSFDYNFPFALVTTPKWKGTSVELTKNSLTVLNVKSNLDANFDFKTGAYHWHLSGKEDELKNVIIRSSSFPIENWRGQIVFDVTLDRDEAGAFSQKGSLELKNYGSYVQWVHDLTRIYGDIRGDLQAEWAQTDDQFQLKRFFWKFDLSDLNIHHANFLKKPEKIALLTEGEGDWSGRFYLKNFKFKFLSMEGTGQGVLTQNQSYHFAFQIPPFSLEGLEKYLPIFSGKPLQGMMEARGECTQNYSDPNLVDIKIAPLQLKDFAAMVRYEGARVSVVGPSQGSFSVNIDGRYNLRDPWDSPLSILGSLSWELPQVSYQSPPSPPSVPSASKTSSSEAAHLVSTIPGAQTATNVSGFLAPSKVIANAKLNAKLKIDEFILDKVKVNSLRLDGQVGNSQLKLSGDIEKIFSGSVQLLESQIPLTEPNPIVRFTSSFQKIDLPQFLSTLFPQWKDLAAGEFSGRAQVSTRLPASETFQKDLFATGDFHLRRMDAKGLPFDYVLKTLLFDVLKSTTNSYLAPYSMEILAKYTLSGSSLKFHPFIATTPRREEFNLEGKLNSDSSVEMTGKIFLVDAPRTNASREFIFDGQNRLIVPLTLSGPALKPVMKIQNRNLNRAPTSRAPAPKMPTNPSAETPKDLFGR